MRRIATIWWVAAFGSMQFAAAQEQEPVVDLPPQDHAMVRFVHLAPNAATTGVTLVSTAEDGGTVAPEGAASLGYMAASDYVPVPAGDYEVRLEAPTLEQTVTFRADRYYTAVLIGLALPADTAAEQSGGGFFEWLRGLFGGDGAADGDRLGLRLHLVEDDPFDSIEPERARIRLVHAAPGTANIDLAVAGERGTLVRNLAFGDVSRRVDLEAADTTLEIRPVGSRAVVLDLGDLDFATGMVHTILFTGTPIEEVPLEVVHISDALAVRAIPEPVDPLAPVDAPPPAPDPVEPEDEEEPEEEPAGADGA